MKAKLSLTIFALLGVSLSLLAQETKEESADTLASQTLGGVEVVAQRPVVKMTSDKLTYDVQADVDAKAQTVLDLLRKVPMVTVDGQDNITVNGSSSFKVYVDGRPNALYSSNPSQVFRSMPASMVQHIEVVTNPGARYDAEGAGGVLNLVMQKTSATAKAVGGYNGSLSATAGTRSYGASAYVAGQQGRFAYSGNAVYNHHTSDGTDVAFDRTSLQGNTMATMRYHQRSTAKLPFTMANVFLGYDVDSLSTLSANVGWTGVRLNTSGNPETRWLFGDRSYGYASDMAMKNVNQSLTAGVDYQHWLNADHRGSLALGYLFTMSDNENDTRFAYGEHEPLPLTLNDYRSDAKGQGYEHTLQADLSLPLRAGHKFDVGAKYINRKNTSDSRYYNIVGTAESVDTSLSMDYDNRQHIAAAYAEYDGRFGPFNAKGGLRYEQTWERTTYAAGQGDNFSRRYGNLVPSAALTLSLKPTMNVGLTYNMRLSRPGITYLNPFVTRGSDGTLSYGNPSLNAEKTHNMAVAFNTFSRKFTASLTLGQTLCNDGIEQYSFVSDGVLNTTYGNVAKSRQTFLNVFVNWSPVAKTRLTLSGRVAYADLRSDALDRSNHGWQANVWAGVQQTLPLDLKLSAGIFAKSKDYTLQGYNGGMNMLNASLSRTLLNGKLDLSANYMVPLTGKLHISQHSYGQNFVQDTKIVVPLQSISFTAKWNFGNTRRRYQQHQSRLRSDFNEQQGAGQQINHINRMGQ